MKNNILLLVELSKGWSDAARVAAMAARQAKKDGNNPRQAAAIAKKLVEKGVEQSGYRSR